MMGSVMVSGALSVVLVSGAWVDFSVFFVVAGMPVVSVVWGFAVSLLVSPAVPHPNAVVRQTSIALARIRERILFIYSPFNFDDLV
jgi:hypothetical protein